MTQMTTCDLHNATIARLSDEVAALTRELAAERERADRLIAFLADDALAITYQSLAQYRQAAIDAARRKANDATLKATGERLAALNRRAAVEQILFDAAAGKRHLPGPEECRALAMKLGVPDELRDPRFDAMLRGESNG